MINTEKAIKFLNDQELYKNCYPEDDLQEHIARQMQKYADEQLNLYIVSSSLTSKEAIDYEIYAKRKDKEENLKGWVFALFFGTAFVIGIIALISWIGS